MHAIVRLCLLLLSVMILSCSDERQPIVSPRDYENIFKLTDQSLALVEHQQAMSFWRERYENDRKDYVALSKLAFLYAGSYRLTGTTDDLMISDSLLRVVLTASGPSAPIHRQLAVNSISRHGFWEAKRHAQRALDVGENRAESLYILADVLLELGNVDSARTILNNFTNKKSFSWLIRHLKVLDREGNLDSAITVMENAYDVVKANEELSCWSKTNLADMYGHAGRVRDAYRTYLEVLRIEPDNDYALKGIAWIALSHDGNLPEAERILEKLMQKRKLPEYYLLLAEINRVAGQNGTAEKYEDLFINHVSPPTFGDMYNRHLVDLYMKRNQIRIALDLAKRELQVRRTPESFALLAWALSRNGLQKEALAIAEDHVVGQSQEPEVNFHLGEIYSRSDKTKARSYLELALQSSFEIGPLKTKEIELILRAL